MIRVMLDIGNAPPKTGIRVYADSLDHALRHHASDRAVVEEAGVSSVGRGLRPLRRMIYIRRLQKLSQADYNGANVIHFVNLYVPRRRNRVPMVATIHDVDVMHHPEAYPRYYYPYFSTIIRRAIERADRIIAVSNSARDAIIERFPAAVDRVTVTGNSLSPMFTKAVDEIGKLHGSPRPFFLFVGRLERKKNLTWLIKTFAAGVRSQALPNLSLVLAGSRGYGFPEIRRVIEEAGPLVRWIPSPEVTELARLYKQSSAVVLPSLSEGFGIPLLEAMYCDKPIVASRIPSSVEVASGVARFFDLGRADEFFEASKQALEDRGDSRRIEAKKRLKQYSWKEFAEKNMRTYEDVLPVR